MKILSVSLENFASYKKLDFEFSSEGLNLISGPTGSGKSTLCDAIPWILFGRTSKNGTVDEIRSWGNNTPTTGIIQFESGITIKRSRAPNDLWYRQDYELFEVRGRDLNDTQKQINELLGLDVETYLAGAYYHEFSQTAQFFTASAKNRRSLIEQIVDLSKIMKLQENLNLDKKRLKAEMLQLENSIHNYKGQIRTYEYTIPLYEQKCKTFEEDQERELSALRSQINKLELLVKPVDFYLEDIAAYKEAIRILRQEKCQTCGAPINHEQAGELQAKLSDLMSLQKENEYNKQSLTNLDDQSDKIMHRENNFSSLMLQAKQELDKITNDFNGQLSSMKKYSIDLADISVLSDILDSYRILIIINTVEQLETMTNDSLSKYFDAEIRVLFSATSADKLEVEVYKDGNLCTYTQLSKGQRCMLKLCFGVAVMQSVANRHGVDFDQAWFDEALDGLDSNMKLKAFKLLQSLPNNSIFVVEHHAPAEIDFAARYNVTNVNGESQIEQT